MKKLLGIIGVVIVATVIVSCSASKNTGLSRRVQALKTKYNTYYNGNEAFKDGYLAQRDGNRDNYMEMLPYYMIGNKNTVKLVADNSNVP